MSGTVCVIMATYNRAHYICESIDSILAQDYPVSQFIVVNDGSTDETTDVLARYGDRITLINKPNGGKSSALNIALPLCTCDYVWIADDDDLAAGPDVLGALVAALHAHPEAGYAYGRYRIFKSDDPSRKLFDQPEPRRSGESITRISFLEHMFTFQFAMLVRKSAYDRAGPFNEKLIRSQDYDMTLRLTRKDDGIFVDAYIMLQRLHDGIRGTAQEKFAATASMLKWIEYDKVIFGRVAREYALEEYIPGFARQASPERQKRLAIIEKTCIFARRAMWEIVAETLATSDGTAANQEEFKLAEDIAVTNPLVWQDLNSNTAALASLAILYRKNAFCRDVLLALCRPLVWNARYELQHGNLRKAAVFLGLLVRLLGPFGALRRLLRSLLT